MATMMIQSVADVAEARNRLRKVILGEKWSPTMAARGVAALATLGELILGSQATGRVDLVIAPRHGKPGIELSSKIPVKDKESLSLDLVRSQLTRAVDSLEIEEHDDHLYITIFLWANSV